MQIRAVTVIENDAPEFTDAITLAGIAALSLLVIVLPVTVSFSPINFGN